MRPPEPELDPLHFNETGQQLMAVGGVPGLTAALPRSGSCLRRPLPSSLPLSPDHSLPLSLCGAGAQSACVFYCTGAHPLFSKMPPITTTLSLALLLLLLLFTTAKAHNITRILAKHPEFSSFNHYLTLTHLASEINRRETITVLALDNAAMSSLLSKQLPLYTLRNVLSLHVLVDYFGAKKLHQITSGTTLTASMFQATGSAPGTSGYVNITDLNAGKVGFGPEDNGGKLDAHYVKSLVEIPYNISVLQISQALNSAEAEAPTPGPKQFNLTTTMAKQGCKSFASLLTASGADSTFDANIDGGLTVFCVTDSVLKAFMPKYNNLTAAQKVSLLLYHGIPVYQSMQMLKTNNGIMNTLATNGANKYDFTIQNDGEDVTLKTKVVTSKIMGILIDEEPLVIYKVDKVLLPRELFKPEAAQAPKAEKEADSPEADAPDESEDQTADSNDNGASGLDGRRMVMVLMSLSSGMLFYHVN